MCDFTSNLIAFAEHVSVHGGNETILKEDQDIIKDFFIKMMKHSSGRCHLNALS